MTEERVRRRDGVFRRDVIWWVLAGAPFLVVAVVVLAAQWNPTGDDAIFFTRMRDPDAGLPLVGAYSRYGWSHPGPALQWLLLIPYRLTGGSAAAVLAMAVLAKGIAAGAAAWLGSRAAGVAGGVLVLAVLIPLCLAHPDGLTALWNPWLPLLALFTFLVAAWAHLTGERWGVPVMVIGGSVAAQGHVGYLGVVATVSVLCIGRALFLARRRTGGPAAQGHKVTRTVAIVSFVILWVPVLWDQVAGRGNLGDLVRYFAEGDGTVVGFGSAARLMARGLLPWGPWSGGAEPVSLLAAEAVGATPWALLLPALGLCFVWWSAWRLRDVSLTALASVSTAAAAAAMFAIARATPPLYPYLITWTRAVAAILWLAVALAVVKQVIHAAEHRGWRSRPAGAVAAAVAAVGLVALIALPLDELRNPLPWQARSDVVDQLLPLALGAVDSGDDVTVVFGEAFPGVAEGLVYALERDGRIVHVPPDRASVWSGVSAADPAESDTLLSVTEVPGREPPAVPGVEWRRVATVDSLSEDERVELDALARELADRLTDAGRAPEVGFVPGFAGIYRDDPVADGIDVDRLTELVDRSAYSALWVGHPAPAAP